MRKFIRLFQRIILGKTTDEYEIEYLKKNGLKIGKNVNIYSGFNIDSYWSWLISIGNNVTISTNVTILAHDASTNIVGCGTKLGKVTIGDNVFIGTGCTILCDTHIGDNVIIGAGSVVNKNLESNYVYGGVPARRICTIDEYKEKNMKLRNMRPDLSRIRSWDTWNNASDKEKMKMSKLLDDGIGYI